MAFYEGTEGHDGLIGGEEDDGFSGAGGDDTIEGGAGMDTAIFHGNFSDYAISYDSATHKYTLVDQVAGRDGTDVVHGVESFYFADGMRSLGQLVPHAVKINRFTCRSCCGVKFNPPNTAVASSESRRPRIAFCNVSGCSKISLSM